MANDEELAASRANEEPPSFSPRLSEWSPEIEVLVAIYESVRHGNDMFIKAHKGKPGKFERWPRPVTAMQRIRQRRRQQQHEDLVKRLLPEK